MKLKKNVKNILSVIFLLFVLFVLIFSLTSLKKNNNLSANTDNTNKPDAPLFNYVNSRSSLVNGVTFENNFGGSGKEELFTTYKLQYFYLIGKTNSNDCYFSSAKNNSIFVTILDFNGNCKNVYNLSLENEFEIVDTTIFNNSIFILAKNNGLKLIEFNLKTNAIGIIYTNAYEANKLVSADDLVVVYNKNNKTEFLFYYENKTIAMYDKANTFILCANYLNGIICFYNSSNGAQVVLVNSDSVNTLLNLSNYKLITFNITNSGYIFLATYQNFTKLVFLNNNFEINFETIAPSGTNYHLIQLGNYHFLSYLYGGNLKMLNFCSHGDELNNIIIFNSVSSFNTFVLNNNLVYLITNLDGTFNYITCNAIGAINTKLIVPTLSNLKIISHEISNNLNLTLFGNVNGTNTLITENFGNSDIFIFEIQTNL